jgi:hypothetical protein
MTVATIMVWGVSMTQLVTTAQMAAMEFTAVNMQGRERLWAAYTAFNEALAEAICILGKEKDDLVDEVTSAEGHDRRGAWLKRFFEAQELAPGLVHIMETAQCRLACAMAAVEGDD